MFGYCLEENFDLAKERRRGRLMWINGGGLCLLFLCYFLHPFSAAVFQGYFLTSLSYGESFYVQRMDDLHKPWLWKAILATIPLHLLLLLAIVWLDWAFPNFFQKVIVCAPILFLAFGLESVLFDRFVDRFTPHGGARMNDAEANP
jgi:hypothetical protein